MLWIWRGADSKPRRGEEVLRSYDFIIADDIYWSEPHKRWFPVTGPDEPGLGGPIVDRVADYFLQGVEIQPHEAVAIAIATTVCVDWDNKAKIRRPNDGSVRIGG